MCKQKNKPTRRIAQIIAIVLVNSLVGAGIFCALNAYYQRSAQEVPTKADYAVLSVSRYAHPIPNGCGGIAGADIRYTFVYTGDDGELHTVEGFHPTETGNELLRLGEEDRYIVAEDGKKTCLQLSEKTLLAMTGTIS